MYMYVHMYIYLNEQKKTQNKIETFQIKQFSYKVDENILLTITSFMKWGSK